MKMSVRTTLLMSAALLLGGCEVTSEIGKPCALVRKATAEEKAQTGQDTMPILEKEIAARQDFISFGSLGCEDLICVRDQDYPRALNEDGTVNGNAPAMGYCSKPCVEGSSACEVKDTSDVLPGLPERMACRPLLLDQATLEALRAENEAQYRATFGENNSPFFCAGAPVAETGT
ncbi:adventurous gliding motility lipoprotein CglC [Myxococcus sp. RHSTA-1-4]|uniref:adventurous gliding motility lipoprotein CglC n=1 Tax=Myxococcus sp. RHSTA-1-4 TaxID=2874601 RepID=UPI001CC0650C|nr:adventurous gliding motility lipoprotein CglC [Myxococcus sp. RHSTA-1-4]MBZ4417080.1 adventurous gliding motility lipoprotein CglC [Myxococcus sp. RHSTA-1-4]